MLLFTLTRRASRLYTLLLIACLLLCASASAQTRTTSWRGYYSGDWGAANNWTNGLPDANTAVIIGGSAYGASTQYYPRIQGNYNVTVASLTITSVGATKDVALYVRNLASPVTVRGDVNIIGSGDLVNQGSDIVVGGNWKNDGTYTEEVYSTRTTSYYPTVEFSGTGKAVGGTSTNTLNFVTISGDITLTADLTIKPLGTTLSKLEVTGVLDPSVNKVSFTTTPPDGFVVASGATLKVKAPTYEENYGLWPTTLYVNSTIDYAANGSQTVSNQGAYGILRISGGGVKTLSGNTTISAVSAVTQLIVDAGTLDLGTYILDRTAGSFVAGGTLTVANNATLRIGGTGTFPAGYATRNLGSTSTVEYYGANQTVTNEAYGHLTFSGSGTKTMPTAAMSVSGNLTSQGTASFTAGSNITVSGNVDIGNGTTFGGSSYIITVGADWVNNGTFAGNTGAVILNGSARQIIRKATGTAAFNNLSITGGAINVTAPAITVGGNLITTGNGALTQSSGLLTMNGSSKTISGAGISVNNLTIDGAVTTDAFFTVSGNLTVNSGKSFAASAGTILMNGAGKNISSTGTLAFSGLRVLGTVSTGTSFNINSNLSGTGTLTATAGTVTFGGTSTFGGTHNLFNVTVASGKSLAMVANANLGIAGTLTMGGILDVTTNTPNTITYNGTTGQTVPGIAYNNIVFDKTGAKGIVGALTVNGNLTINTGSNFTAGSSTHALYGDWENNGAFTAGSSTVSFGGSADATITGTTTFHNLTVNKASTANNVTLNNSVTTATLALTSGSLRTGANKITVTNSRSGNGWVYGTITRQHAFTSGISYDFAAPYNTISLTSASGVTSVSVTNTSGVVSSFANGSAINRKYDVSIAPVGTYAGIMQLQYDDAGLNGNTEAGLQLYYASASSGPWSAKGATARNATQNWVSNGTLSDVSGSWTLSETASIVRWNGSISTAWLTAGNWTEVGSGSPKVPGTLDIIEFGFVANVPNQPELQTAQTVKAIQFTGAGTPISLSLNGGALTASGNVAASGSGSATTHNLNVNNGTLTAGGSLTLFGGGVGNNINVNITTGSAIAAGDLNHAGNSKIALGSGNFKISGDYNLTAPAANFSAGTGTFTYQGSNAQKMGVVYYNNLTIDKTAGTAELSSAQTGAIGGTLTINKGILSVPAGSYVVEGDVVQNAGTLSIGSSWLEVKKGWTKAAAAVFNAGTSTVNFTGDAAQSVPEAAFNNLTVNKNSGTVTLAGNVTINADLNIERGTISMANKTLNRSAAGGKFIMGSAATLLLDASNFPANYNNYMLDKASTVAYQGTGTQNVAALTYGNLLLQNGATNAKILQGLTSINGDLTVSSGATFNGAGRTLTLTGNFYQNGTFTAGPDYATGTLVLATNGGVQKLLSGNVTANSLLLEAGADYKLDNGDLVVKGNFTNQGSIDGITQKVAFEGDFLNAGTLKGSRVTAFSGTRLQNILLQAPITPGAAGPPTVEFNGAVAPVFNSTTAPNFGSVVIRNTDPAGIRASVSWTVNLKFDVQSGAKFDGGPYTHNFYTAISNAGTIISSGTLNFSPTNLGANLQVYPLNFGTVPGAFQSTGTLNIGGTELVALAGVVPVSLNNLVITNTHQAGVSTQRISDDLPLSGTAWSLTGNLVVANGAKFNAGAGTTYRIGGNLVDNGTLNGSGGGFTLTNAAGLASNLVTVATIDGSGTTTLGSLTIDTGAGVKINKDISVLGDLIYRGKSLSASGVEINFTGDIPSAIAAPASGTLSLGNIKVSKSVPETTVILQTDITDMQTMNVASGTLDLGAYSMSGISVEQSDTDAAVPTLILANGAFLKVGGTGTIPQLSVFDLGETSTVEYYGSNQEVESTQYGHLKTLNAGTKTFKPGTAKIAGDFTKGAEAVVITPDIIEYDGAANQAIAAINYNDLILSNGGDKVFAAGTTGITGKLILSGAASIKAASAGITVDYNGAVIQDVLPTNYYNLKLSNGSIKQFSGTTGIAAGFILADGATAGLTSENIIDFNGAGNQNVPALNYKNVIVSGAGIKTLLNDATVEKQLILTAGELRTGNNKITLGQAEGMISETETAFVTGTVETTRDVPAGFEQSFGSLGIKITPSVAAGLTKVIRVTGTPVGITENSILRTFAVEPASNNGSLDAIVTISYFEHELNNNPENELVFYRSENGVDNWQLQPVEKTTSDAATNQVSITGFSKFSSVTIGSINSPLPVEILYFNAVKSGRDANLTWATATEQDNKGFAVEVSADGYTFRQLGFVKSKVTTSSVMQKYSFTDAENGKTGLRYYRLRQTDISGKETIYAPKALDFGFIVSAAVTAYPNPFSSSLTLAVEAVVADVAKITVYDAVGKQLFAREQHVPAGASAVPLPVAAIRQTGVYLLTVVLNSKVYRLKVVRE